MSKLSTKNVKTAADFTPKNLEPGNVKARMLDIVLDQPDFLKKDDAYFVVMNLEGEKPSEDFVGFHTVFGDESSPTFEGPTAKVKASKWSYRTSTTKKGVVIDRDEEIMKFLKNLCEALGCVDWWNAVDNKYETIQDFVTAFNKEKPFAGIWANWCIGGRQYTKPNGYKGWDLHLPKFSKDGIPFEAVDVANSRLAIFNYDAHTEITEAKPVDDFEDIAVDDTAVHSDLPDMEDAADFEL